MDTQGLLEYTERTYKATAGLMKLVPEDKLDWKPSAENNWFTLGQTLFHLAAATGVCFKGFITGEWPDMPDGGDAPPPEEPDPATMLPSAEKMPTVASVAEALEKLEADRRLAAQMLNGLSEEDFRNRMVAAPWEPNVERPLWFQLLYMVEHQVNHKAGLFAMLKILGVPVHTGNLYGM